MIGRCMRCGAPVIEKRGNVNDPTLYYRLHELTVAMTQMTAELKRLNDNLKEMRASNGSSVTQPVSPGVTSTDQEEEK